MLVKLEWLGYRTVKTLFKAVFIQYRNVTDGRTDRQTDLLYQYRASVCWRALKTVCTVCETETGFTKLVKPPRITVSLSKCKKYGGFQYTSNQTTAFCRHSNTRCQSDTQKFWRQDLSRCKTTSLEQSAALSQTIWAVVRPVQAITENIFIRTGRPRRSVNCF